MKKFILDIFLSIVLGFGVLLMISPFVLAWFIHGDYARYLWIISGPFPFSNFGGGPFQLFMYTGLFCIGLVVTAITFLIKRKLFNQQNNVNTQS